MKEELFCDWCKKKLFRYPSQIKKFNFCSRGCLASYSSKRKNPHKYASFKDYTNISKNMALVNKRLNPTRMSFEVRCKLRQAKLGKGRGKTYEKFFGRLTHRVVAEMKIGRKLRAGEVVHHIDENIRNNSPDNLMVFENQALHVEWHSKHMRGGDK